ncbi:type I polyketide synthase [Catenuloplanes indicus]|uniref:Enediyne polyketide synthase n=1 Tax=Catenuloplanes indicus TaxID=137267 RepID=A0AAE3VVD4_9ACTN|nr:type I polyketide synthase [Catenuloplanes indicus]MDQ0364404.1 enediyne polyketide synthase [Catenuloplanes indicus]
MTRIAVVGMSCRYPDATSPQELWENALAGRRAFRRLPDVRMNLDDYYDADPAVPDKFYARNAAVIEGYRFDRVAYKVAGSTFRSTDLTHWLALDVAAMALADAGFPMGEGLPRERTGVVVGNSLTGEFSRANQLRLRWPYVRRMVAAALKEQNWDDDQLGGFLDDFEATFKGPFPAIDEDTLAGALSNTIAGRICNYFDLKGGGYTVDGACSSSLLSVATAGKALIDGDVDVAVAGGVDLSIDPFEIIGFAKTGALASGEMRVYDRAANGFWPGEGCGMVVLMRERDALRAGHRVYASIAGWGISSDGKGGMTRPESAGYQLALDRAYERAGFGIETISLFEGHGTGTKVGDATELGALSAARRRAGATGVPAAIGSIKGMIGHTKAAAGVAGLIKAALAVHHQVLPPSVGCVDPNEQLTGDAPALRVLRRAEAWPDGAPVRAGVTAMGFGGINTHVVLENPRPRRRSGLDTRTRALASSVQDTELLLLDAADTGDLIAQLDRLIEFLPSIAYAQLADLAATLHAGLRDRPVRAAVLAGSPHDAEQRLRRLRDEAAAGRAAVLSPDGTMLLGTVAGPARIGFLFPGQGSGRGMSGGALRRRFGEAEEVYADAALPEGADAVATEVAQPRIVTGSLAGLRVLGALGIEAAVAVGHSLGEISALHWAGALDERAVLRVAATRGRTMAEHSASGTMAGLNASPETAAALIEGLPLVIAAYNGPAQTVIAGETDAIEAAARRAREAGLIATPLRVSHAFHSPLVAPAADEFVKALSDEVFGPVGRRVESTVTGAALEPDADLAELLRRQITEPVRFSQAVTRAAADVALFVEVGPGQVLGTLTATVCDVPVVSLDTDSESLAGLLRTVAAAWVVGAAGIDPALFHGRLVRPLQIGAEFTFFTSPCEQAPDLRLRDTPRPVRTPAAPAAAPGAADSGESTVDRLRRLAAARAELPVELVHEGSMLLDDLHLSSITVGQVVNSVAAELDLPAAAVPTNFATATIAELATALDEISRTARDSDRAGTPAVAGAAPWARPWRVDAEPVPLPARPAAEPDGPWQLHAPPGHPFATGLRDALRTAGVGGGVLVCLPADCAEDDLRLALDGAQAAATAVPGTRFVLVEHGRGAAGLAKTLRLEAPQLRVSVVRVPAGIADPIGLIVGEVAATTGFTEAHYDADGQRRVPTLRAMPVRPARTETPLTGDDVLLVTGGGKGITAECALAIAEDTGAALALLGRSDPATDADLAANLERITAAGVRMRYARADVTDGAQVRDAVARLTAELGPVTAVLHGAGRNEPAAMTGLDMDAFRRTLAPKIDGLRAVLAAVDPGRLRLLVTLGSIIGRSGLRGEAHYATANDWLADLTAEVGREHPGCRSLCLEWSVWSGVGMGERLSVVESLTREGVTPVTPEQGLAVLRRLLADPQAPGTVVISGRAEGIDTIRRHLPPLPLSRFVERPLIRYHGVELVSEAELNVGVDRYLADHDLDGNLLFPAVFGMEAMAQVAAAVTGVQAVPVIERAEFLRPIIVPPHGRLRIRIAAVVTDDDIVEVAIRAEDTLYAADHFTARLRLSDTAVPDGPPDQAGDDLPAVPLDPARDLYDDILFQGARFQRLRRYHRSAARHVDADVEAVPSTDWFARFVPDQLLLGDPGVRDTLMHGNQVCVPDATLLPAGVDRIYPGGEKLAAAQGLRYSAVERSRDGDTYVYDIALRTGTGEIVERWEGLRLRAVRKQDPAGPWAPPLVGPYLERAVEDLTGVRVAVAVEPGVTTDVAGRRAATTLAAGRAFGRAVEVRHRPDGRPEVDGDRTVSAAHGAGITLFVAAPGPLSCDVEPVVERDPADWAGLLGAHAGLSRLIADDLGEDVQTAATRVWTAIECLRKAGHVAGEPLTLRPAGRARWVELRSGGLRIATFVTTLRDVAEPVVLSVLVGPGE